MVFFSIFKGERRRKKKKKKKAKHWWDTLSVSLICYVMSPSLVVNYYFQAQRSRAGFEILRALVSIVTPFAFMTSGITGNPYFRKTRKQRQFFVEVFCDASPRRIAINLLGIPLQGMFLCKVHHGKRN